MDSGGRLLADRHWPPDGVAAGDVQITVADQAFYGFKLNQFATFVDPGTSWTERLIGKGFVGVNAIYYSPGTIGRIIQCIARAKQR